MIRSITPASICASGITKKGQPLVGTITNSASTKSKHVYDYLVTQQQKKARNRRGKEMEKEERTEREGEERRERN